MTSTNQDNKPYWSDTLARARAPRAEFRVPRVRPAPAERISELSGACPPRRAPRANKGIHKGFIKIQCVVTWFARARVVWGWGNRRLGNHRRTARIPRRAISRQKRTLKRALMCLGYEGWSGCIVIKASRGMSDLEFVCGPCWGERGARVWRPCARATRASKRA